MADSALRIAGHQTRKLGLRAIVLRAPRYVHLRFHSSGCEARIASSPRFTRAFGEPGQAETLSVTLHKRLIGAEKEVGAGSCDAVAGISLQQHVNRTLRLVAAPADGE
jgi:hypothetical protein